MMGREDDPASYWEVVVTFQGLFLLNFGRVGDDLSTPSLSEQKKTLLLMAEILHQLIW